MTSRAGGKVLAEFPAQTVEYALPPLATSEIRDFWRPEARAVLPPQCSAQLSQGRVFGDGIVLSPDGQSIARDVSLDFGKAAAQHWLVGHKRIPPAQPVAGPTAVIATALGRGYGHWLLDELPRLLALPPRAVKTLIAHRDQAFSRAALEHFGWHGDVIVPKRTTHFECEQLIVPAITGTVVQPTPAILDLVTAFAGTLPESRSRFGERLYFTRDHARRRRVTNETELRVELEARGFVTVRLEDLTWPEQISAFRHAKLIVAPHGAGLANLAFCTPGTRVIELFNRAYVHGCYWRLAALRRLDYRPIVPPAPGPLEQSPGSNRLDILADLAQLRTALR
jgi:capsular polysaccharide biosynthesis protein